MKNKTNFINCLLFFGILWFVFGCADTDSGSQTNPNKQRLRNNEPATISLHQAELVREFEGNEVRANQLYKGKRVRIHGNVNSVSTSSNGGFVLTYRTSVSTYSPAQCYFSQEYANQLAKIQTNDEVEVEGTVLGFTNSRFAVALEDCSIP
jgi:tRNA_anti-like